MTGINLCRKYPNSDHMNKIVIFVALMLFGSLSGQAQNCKKDACNKINRQKFGKTNMKKDANFAVEAAEGGMMEVMLGKLAATNAASPDVKELGMELVSDHSAANDELEVLAKRKNIALPTLLSKRCEKKYNKFTRKTGKKFDKCYTRYMVKDHKKDIKCFRKEADKGSDAEIKAWASGKVPVLEHHLDLAKNACEAVKKEK
jgi:putative membrane protein